MKKGKAFLTLLVAVLMAVTMFSGCAQKSSTTTTAGTTTAPATTAATTAVTTTAAVTTAAPTTAGEPTSISYIYQNTKYGFNFTLPETWKGFSIVTTKWEGSGLLTSTMGKIVATGPIINIRHPLWTSTIPRQDIPIMVFTLAQWASLQKEEFSVSAAPILPSELGRNAKYVLALPARYNFSSLPGYKEVETILAGSPLKPF
jgi:hypothetical protein